MLVLEHDINFDIALASNASSQLHDIVSRRLSDEATIYMEEQAQILAKACASGDSAALFATTRPMLKKPRQVNSAVVSEKRLLTSSVLEATEAFASHFRRCLHANAPADDTLTSHVLQRSATESVQHQTSPSSLWSVR